MKTTAGSARSLAAHAVARILREGVTLDAALKDALAAADPKLAPSVRSLSYGAVRGYYRHEAILGRLLSTPVRSLDPLVRALLSVALYELEDERTPEYAVVDAAVQTAKATDAARAAGLINAVLRRYLRERKSLDAEIARNPATRHASPVWLADRLRADWPVRWTQLLAAGDAQAPMWLRVNSRLDTAEEYLEKLREAGIGARAEARVPHAVVLDAPCDVHDLPGFAQGAGVRSRPGRAVRCISFGVGRGSAGARCLRGPGRENRPHRGTASPIWPSWWRSTSTRSGSPGCGRTWSAGSWHAELVAGDAAAPEAWWDGVPFDRILLDAPCSALGVIRRHPDIRLRKSPSDIDKLPQLQARLLAAAWRLLAPGGRLVYATCTVTRSENRDLIARVSARHSRRGQPPGGAVGGLAEFGRSG